MSLLRPIIVLSITTILSLGRFQLACAFLVDVVVPHFPKPTNAAAAATNTASSLHLALLPLTDVLLTTISPFVVDGSSITSSATTSSLLDTSSSSSSTPMSQFLLLTLMQLRETDPENAKSQFYFFFFAGSGAGGIGLSQFPRVYREIQTLRSIANDPTEGGPTLLGNNPAVSFFYPQAISQQDLRTVISQIPSAEQITAQGKSTSYPASRGYVVQEDFLLALLEEKKRKKCNPMAAYATFEALSKGSGKVISPDDFDAKLALYKTPDQLASLEQVSRDLQQAAVTKLGAYVTLAVLLFVSFDLICETGLQAFV